MQKYAIWSLSVVVLILSAVCGWLALAHDSHRFIHTGPGPYMMFDEKTAQACWGGPPTKEGIPANSVGQSEDLSPDGLSQDTHDKLNKFNSLFPFPKNPAGLLVCKDLK